MIDLVAIPPGSYRRSDGAEVRVTRWFALQRTPVTVAQYAAFVAATGYPAPEEIEYWDGDWRPGMAFAAANAAGDHPAVGVSFDDACVFLTWLAAKDGRPYRLPTEAEYGLAARAGCGCGAVCASAEALPASFVRNGAAAAIRSVGSAAPNRFGLHDMHGLIWQWCADWYAELAAADVADPVGPPEPPELVMWKGEPRAAGRVICGGSFSYPREQASCHHRHYSMVGDRNFNVGLRVALSLEAAP